MWRKRVVAAESTVDPRRVRADMSRIEANIMFFDSSCLWVERKRDVRRVPNKSLS